MDYRKLRQIAEAIGVNTEDGITPEMKAGVNAVDNAAAKARTTLGLDVIDATNPEDKTKVLSIIALAGILVAEITYNRPERREASMELSKMALEVSALCRIRELDERGGLTRQ